VQDGKHIFAIYDSGIAIEKKGDLFEAFKSTKLKGNGLGLVLCKQIAEVHNGSVELCDGLQKCFTITIPIRQEE
jgi:two-component system NtrC family sensor kinase/two-component system sensor histidine kinase AtoS